MSLRSNTLASAAIVGAFCALAVPAAAATFTFVPGGSSPTAGYNVVNTFDSAAGLSGIGFEIKTPPADGNGAPPANSTFPGSAYLSVLGGGNATYTFGPGVTGFQFDWGSVDSYNVLTFVTNIGDEIVIPGSSFISPSDGNQSADSTNGLFTAFAGVGETFTSVTWASSQNSFEVDNLAIAAVPEPGTWMMMMIGFGMIGATARYRRRHSRITYA